MDSIQKAIDILAEERNRINEAIRILESITAPTAVSKVATKTGRHMSAEARARISRAMKLRWAKHGNKKGTGVTAPAAAKKVKQTRVAHMSTKVLPLRKAV